MMMAKKRGREGALLLKHVARLIGCFDQDNALVCAGVKSNIRGVGT